jgi:Mycoplasma protein of unknown function, DUF285
MSGWNVANGTYLAYMFRECEMLNSDVSGWNLADALAHGMFHNCWSFDGEFVSGWPEYAKRGVFME